MFHVLIALADGEKHGYAIIKEVSRRTDGAIRLSAGTLYRSPQLTETGARRYEGLLRSTLTSGTDETFAQALSVAPVVCTSSTSTASGTRRPALSARCIP